MTALSQTPFSMEERGSYSIYEDCKRGSCDAGKNPFYEGVIEAQMGEKKPEIDPAYSVKGLREIDFQDRPL